MSGDEPAEKTGPSRRSIMAWGAGMLLFLAVVWAVAAVAVPFWQTRAVLRGFRPSRGELAGTAESPAIAELGGSRAAAGKLALYLRMPGWLAPERRKASHLLRWTEVPAESVYLELISDPDLAIRCAAAAGLSLDGPQAGAEAVEALIRAIDDPEPHVRRTAISALISVGPTREAVPALVRALRDRPANLRDYASLALEAAGPEAEDAVPALLDVLRGDKNGCTRMYAARALGAIGPAAAPAVPALKAALSDEYMSLPPAAAEALGNIGPPARSAMPDLLKALRHGWYENRQAAARTLCKLAPPAEVAVPALIKLLGDKDPGVRWTAARELGRIGPVAKAARPALARALSDHGKHVRVAAACALWKMGDARGIPVLEATLVDKTVDDGLRHTAREALEEIRAAQEKSPGAK